MRRPSATIPAAALLLTCVVAAAPLPPRPQRGVPARGKMPAARASLDGVSLAYSMALAPEVKATLAPAAPLESADEKPDWFWPQHVVFDLSAAYRQAPPAHARPEIHVAPVEGFRRAASVSKDIEGQVVRTMRDLARLLRRRSPAPAGAIPTVPFPDAHDAFRARLKYLRFKNGSGVAYLTQSQQDEDYVSNGRLTYEFRGLTDDGRHYVYASLPAAAPFLAADANAAGREGYRRPDSFDGPDRPAKLRAYRAYVARVRRRLERLPPDRFAPSLRLVDEMLSSLEINK
jgi:hypothetical protein